MYEADADRCFFMILKAGAMAKAVGTEQHAALQELDVVVLSDLVIEKLLGLCHDKCDNEGLVSFFSDPDEAMDAAVKEAADGSAEKSPLLFLMNNTRVEQVKKVADKNLVMPHKSTYFYPKILTGLLINKIVAKEKIR
jgi:uncharacterized protein (DUF1015 family)